MPLRDLTVSVMLHLTAPWMTRQRKRKTLEGVPCLASILPMVDEAHQNLLATEPTPDENDAKVREISEQQLPIDRDHDRRVRGVLQLMDAVIILSDDEEKVAALTTLRDRLAPDGAQLIQTSYAAEAGSALLLEQRLTKADWKLLASLKIAGIKTDEQVRGWIGAAKKLGVLEEQKVDYKNKLVATQKSSTRQVDVVTARNRWMAMVRLVDQTLQLGNVDQATVDKIMVPINVAAAKAAKGDNSLPEDDSEDAPATGSASATATAPAPAAAPAPAPAPGAATAPGSS